MTSVKENTTHKLNTIALQRMTELHIIMLDACDGSQDCPGPKITELVLRLLQRTSDIPHTDGFYGLRSNAQDLGGKCWDR